MQPPAWLPEPARVQTRKPAVPALAMPEDKDDEVIEVTALGERIAPPGLSDEYELTEQPRFGRKAWVMTPTPAPSPRVMGPLGPIGIQTPPQHRRVIMNIMNTPRQNLISIIVGAAALTALALMAGCGEGVGVEPNNPVLDEAEKIRTAETERKNQELEDEVQKLQEQNAVLEEKAANPAPVASNDTPALMPVTSKPAMGSGSNAATAESYEMYFKAVPKPAFETWDGYKAVAVHFFNPTTKRGEEAIEAGDQRNRFYEEEIWLRTADRKGNILVEGREFCWTRHDGVIGTPDSDGDCLDKDGKVIMTAEVKTYYASVETGEPISDKDLFDVQITNGWTEATPGVFAQCDPMGKHSGAGIAAGCQKPKKEVKVAEADCNCKK